MKRILVVLGLLVGSLGTHALLNLSRPATLVIDKCNKPQVTT